MGELHVLPVGGAQHRARGAVAAETAAYRNPSPPVTRAERVEAWARALDDLAGMTETAMQMARELPTGQAVALLHQLAVIASTLGQGHTDLEELSFEMTGGAA